MSNDKALPRTIKAVWLALTCLFGVSALFAMKINSSATEVTNAIPYDPKFGFASEHDTLSEEDKLVREPGSKLRHFSLPASAFPILGNENGEIVRRPARYYAVPLAIQ